MRISEDASPPLAGGGDQWLIKVSNDTGAVSRQELSTDQIPDALHAVPGPDSLLPASCSRLHVPGR